MKVIDNYSIVSSENRRKLKGPEIGMECSVLGEVNSQDVVISKAIIVKTNEVCANGEEYFLHEADKAYDSFVKAVNRGFNILESWDIKGNCRQGYFISGYIKGVPIEDRICGQEGNFLDLESYGKVFVMWSDYCARFSLRMNDCAIAGDDIRFPENFDWFGARRCIPKIRF